MLPALGLRPRVEAVAVDVVAAGSLAVHDILFVGLERHTADGAVLFIRHGLAIAVAVSGLGVGRRDGRCIGEDLTELGGDERELVSQVLGGVQYTAHGVDDVLAVVAHARVGAVAAQELANFDRVQVSRCARYGHGFLRLLLIAAAGAFDDEHALAHGAAVDDPV